MNVTDLLTRRQLFLAGSLGAAAYFVPGVFADELARTPSMTEGPFYPDRLPLDTDNDLVIVGNSTTPAVGEITHLTGRVLTPNGSGLNNLTVEIWQVDGNGAYLHTGTSNANRRDRNFQGFGRFTTNQQGEYRFRTVKPVAYPGRCPHIHFKIKRGDRELLVTQLFITGEPSNARDGIYRGVGGIVERELVTVDFRRIPESRIRECRANFDIVLGVTPAERGSKNNHFTFSRSPWASASNALAQGERLTKGYFMRFSLTIAAFAAAILLAASVTDAQPGGKKGDKAKSETVDEFVAKLMTFNKAKDGKLTKEELTDKRLLALFDRADTNKDGVVTRAELEALYQREKLDGGGFGPGGDKGKGGFGPDKKGFKGKGPQPGAILPGFIQDALNLTDTQKKQIADLQKEVDAKLDKILTAEQRDQLRSLVPPKGFGPGDKKGPPPNKN